jgi:hypothetical protein
MLITFKGISEANAIRQNVPNNATIIVHAARCTSISATTSAVARRRSRSRTRYNFESGGTLFRASVNTNMCSTSDRAVSRYARATALVAADRDTARAVASSVNVA